MDIRRLLALASDKVERGDALASDKVERGDACFCAYGKSIFLNVCLKKLDVAVNLKGLCCGRYEHALSSL